MLTASSTAAPTTASATMDSPPDDPYEIDCTIPDGIVISRTKYGLGIFTTRDFYPNEVLYTGVYYNLPDFGYDRPLLLKTQYGNYSMTTEMHTVGIGHGTESKYRQLFTFDSFMNHSCNPNTYSADELETPSGGSYKTVALRYIAAGEQITCDYDLFEYDSRNKGIEKCECGSNNCRGASLGFSFLSKDLQYSLLSRAYPEVVSSWLLANPNILYRELKVPTGFAYRQVGDDLHLIATKNYHSGEFLHSYSTEYFDSTQYDTIILKVETEIYDEKNQIIIPCQSDPMTNSPLVGTNMKQLINIKKEIVNDEDERVSVSTSSNDEHGPTSQSPISMANNDIPTAHTHTEEPSSTTIHREMWHEPTYIVKKLDLIVHTVNRGNNIRECFGWDTFCNHSCEPNADFIYVNGSINETRTIARKDIAVGDMITCDYTLFDTELDGSEFLCECGAPSCKGIIKG